MSNIPRLLRLPLSDCQTGWLGLGACSDKVLSVGHFFIAFVDCKSTIPDLLQCKCEKGAWFNDRLASNFVRWGIKATSVFLDEMRSASSQLSHIFIELQQCKFFWTSAYKFMSREEAYEFKRAARRRTCADTRNAFARYFLPPAFVDVKMPIWHLWYIPCKLQNQQEHLTTWASLTSYLKRFPWTWSCRDGASSPGRKRNPPEGSTNLIQIASIHVGKYNKNQHCTEYEALLSVFS